jgi:hypothetical protein
MRSLINISGHQHSSRHRNSSSIMSDLAPFVAAVLPDQSNADMKQEVDSQRREIDSLFFNALIISVS